MGRYAHVSSVMEPADFVMAGLGAFAVAVVYAWWAPRHGWRGPGTTPGLVVALAAATLLGLGLGQAVQTEWPGGWYDLDCPADDEHGCDLVAAVPAPALWMLLIGAVAGSGLFLTHHIRWRAAPWWMLAMPLAAAMVVASDADVRLVPWVLVWAAWLLLLPGAVRVGWPQGRDAGAA